MKRIVLLLLFSLLFHGDSFAGFFNVGEKEDGKFDLVTGAVLGIDYPHHEIHSGSAFAVHQWDLTLTANEQMNVCFTTPDTAKWVHFTAFEECTQPCTFQILRGPTVTAGSGSTVTPTNQNENSSKTSTIYNLEATPTQNSVQIGATITADGTEIHGEVIGQNNKGGAASGIDRHEYILKQNETYCARLLRDGTAGNSISNLEINWYEHTDKYER